MDQILLRLSPQDVNVILASLGRQPLAEVLNTYVRIQQQLQAATGQSVPGDAPGTTVDKAVTPNANGAA